MVCGAQSSLCAKCYAEVDLVLTRADASASGVRPTLALPTKTKPNGEKLEHD